jgi:hypothetical protein
MYLQTLSADADLSLYNAVASYNVTTGELLPRWMRCSNVGPADRNDKKFKSLLATGRSR